MPFVATWTDLEITGLSELIQTQKDKYHGISHVGNLKKMIQKNFFTKQEQKRSLWLLKGQGGLNWEFGFDLYTLVCKIDNQQGSSGSFRELYSIFCNKWKKHVHRKLTL